MKKLFILTPAMLLTAMIYSANMSTINVDLTHAIRASKPHGEQFQRLRDSLSFQVNLNAETFHSLAQRVYNSRLEYDPGRGQLINQVYPDLVIKEFSWESDGSWHRHKSDLTTLSDAGIHGGARLFANLEEPEEELIKEPELEQ